MQKIAVNKVRFGRTMLVLASLLAAVILYVGIATGVGESGPTTVFNFKLECPNDKINDEFELLSLGNLNVRGSLNCTPGLTGGLTVVVGQLGNSLFNNVEGNVESNSINKYWVQETEFLNINSRNNFGLNEGIELKAALIPGDFPGPTEINGADFMSWKVDYHTQ